MPNDIEIENFIKNQILNFFLISQKLTAEQNEIFLSVIVYNQLCMLWYSKPFKKKKKIKKTQNS